MARSAGFKHLNVDLPGNNDLVIPDTQSEINIDAEMASVPPVWHSPFVPRRWLLNGHLQTIVGNFLPRPAFRLEYTDEIVEVDPADGSRVLCHCSWQPEVVRAERLTIVMVHGLEGSSDSRYVRGLAARAWNSGCNVIRMNMRNCGGTESLTPTLYNSALSGDVAAVVKHFVGLHALQQVALVGYSMGGNMVVEAVAEVRQSGALVRGCRGMSGDRSFRRLRCVARVCQSHLRMAFFARAYGSFSQERAGALPGRSIQSTSGLVRRSLAARI